MKKLIFIKLGGSVITDKNVPYKADIKNIKRLAGQLKKSKIGLVLAHGSGSFGHTSASKYGGKKGYKNTKGIAKVARDAMEINRIVMDALIDEGVPAVSFRPMSLITAKGGIVSNTFFDGVKLAIDQGLVPVFYGDVIWDEKWKSTIYSGETILDILFRYLIKNKYKIDTIIEIGKTDGFYDKNLQTIPVIDKKNWPNFKKFIFKTKEKDVTGGMLHKVDMALEIARLGVRTIIINGNKKNELAKVFLGKNFKGTTIK